MRLKKVAKHICLLLSCFLLGLIIGTSANKIHITQGATVIPEKAIALFNHDFASSVKSAQMSLYTPYGSGSVENAYSEVMKYVGIANRDTNGVKTDITDYVNLGKSGDVFGATIKIKVQSWNAAENKANKVKLFFEVVSPSGKKKIIDLDSKGPNGANTNLTNSNYALGDNWLTEDIKGQAKVNFTPQDKIYLCITQKNTAHWYDEITLYGFINPQADAKVIKINTPKLNSSGSTFSFIVKNTTNTDEKITIKVESTTNDKVKVKEYIKIIETKTEKATVTLPGKKGDIITITDTNDNVYVSGMVLGSQKWVGTWATANQSLNQSRSEYPPKPGLKNNTLRQVIRISTGGTQFRLKLSNEYGNMPLEIKAVQIAQQMNRADSLIDVTTDTTVTFGGMKNVTIKPGDIIYSDLIEFYAKPMDRLAITMSFGSVPSIITSHTGARNTTFIAEGNRVSDISLSNTSQCVAWYFITGLDVMSNENAKAVAILGDSITDGYGVTINMDNRWTDAFTERLQSDASTSHISVLNQGIGGNSIFGGLGPAAINRYKRDILDQEGVGYVIIFEAINDIGSANSTTLTNRIINEYKKFADQAHGKGIKIYGATILPFEGSSGYYNSSHGKVREQIRQDLNAWIRNNTYFDGVIDLDAALRDKNKPSYIAKEFDNDGLHPNLAGYKKIGESIDLSLFK